METWKAPKSPAGNGATTTPPLTAGLTLESSEAGSGNPRSFQISAPVLAFRQCTTLSVETKKILPSATVGEERIGLPVRVVQTTAPLPASKATTVP